MNTNFQTLAARAAICVAASALALPVSASDLVTFEIRPSAGQSAYEADGVVEAVRQSVLSVEVSGKVVGVAAKAGDRVGKGQVLIQVDPRSAGQQAAATAAMAGAAEADLELARTEVERSRRLYAKHYISQSALDQAEAQFKAADAQLRARRAQADAAATETSLRAISAPYGGVLSSVDVELGDMASPGRPLASLYDPTALRVTVTLPESIALRRNALAPVTIEIPGVGVQGGTWTASAAELLPAAEPESHTLRLRLRLPAIKDGPSPVPGMFARARILTAGTADARILIPASALMRRTELQAVYVVDRAGKAWLRQVRAGRAVDQQVEILSGLEAGERVALDPLAASR